jgi:tellurite resistance protein TehA-like permease
VIRKLREGVENLFPGYFALVMATGIVSLAAHFLEMELIARSLFWLNHGLFVFLVALTLARIVLVPRRVLKDLTDHQTGATFLTVVAGTAVFGTQHIVQVEGAERVAQVLWIVALALWVILIYSFFTSVTVRVEKPPLEKGLNGAWLLAVVSTQSVSVLGTLVSSQFAGMQDVVLFFTLCMFLLGCMLYLLIITLIFYRFTFFTMTAADLTPPYWINMGAVAITTMAGARLLLQANDWPPLQELRPFLKGFTLFFWATATWWIPFLLVLGDWRHLIKRVPFSYHPAYWSMVFPLGMYTAATFQLARSLGLSFLWPIPVCFIYVALGAWLIVFVVMLTSIAKWLLARPDSEPLDKERNPS